MARRFVCCNGYCVTLVITLLWFYWWIKLGIGTVCLLAAGSMIYTGSTRLGTVLGIYYSNQWHSFVSSSSMTFPSNMLSNSTMNCERQCARPAKESMKTTTHRATTSTQRRSTKSCLSSCLTCQPAWSLLGARHTTALAHYMESASVFQSTSISSSIMLDFPQTIRWVRSWTSMGIMIIMDAEAYFVLIHIFFFNFERAKRQ